MDPVIHFEMPAEDGDRVREFYESAFGWQTTPLGPEMGDFVLAFTTKPMRKPESRRSEGPSTAVSTGERSQASPSS
jgi:uncharacterized protein